MKAIDFDEDIWNEIELQYGILYPDDPNTGKKRYNKGHVAEAVARAYYQKKDLKSLQSMTNEEKENFYTLKKKGQDFTQGGDIGPYQIKKIKGARLGINLTDKMIEDWKKNKSQFDNSELSKYKLSILEYFEKDPNHTIDTFFDSLEDVRLYFKFSGAKYLTLVDNVHHKMYELTENEAMANISLFSKKRHRSARGGAPVGTERETKFFTF